MEYSKGKTHEFRTSVCGMGSLVRTWLASRNPLRSSKRDAASGVAEVWIEDLQHDKILVFRDPAGDAYKTCLTFGRGDSLCIAALPDIIFKVDDLLG